MDANYLYGYAMRQFLPTGGFKWMDAEVIENWTEFIINQKDEQEVGYFLEVDLEYPEELHNTHNNYPCAPEKIEIIRYWGRNVGQNIKVKNSA